MVAFLATGVAVALATLAFGKKPFSRASFTQAKIPSLLIFLMADVDTRNVSHSPVSGTIYRLRYL